MLSMGPIVVARWGRRQPGPKPLFTRSRTCSTFAAGLEQKRCAVFLDYTPEQWDLKKTLRAYFQALIGPELLAEVAEVERR